MSADSLRPQNLSAGVPAQVPAIVPALPAYGYLPAAMPAGVPAPRLQTDLRSELWPGNMRPLPAAACLPAQAYLQACRDNAGKM
jgi:hypothetical protein